MVQGPPAKTGLLRKDDSVVLAKIMSVPKSHGPGWNTRLAVEGSSRNRRLPLPIRSVLIK